MESKVDRLDTKDSTFAELVTIVHEGREFTNLGACESTDGKRLAAYDYGERVGNWDGSVTFGRVVRRREVKQWMPLAGGHYVDVTYIRVQRPDGTYMHGRDSGAGSFVRLKAYK